MSIAFIAEAQSQVQDSVYSQEEFQVLHDILMLLTAVVYILGILVEFATKDLVDELPHADTDEVSPKTNYVRFLARLGHRILKILGDFIP